MTKAQKIQTLIDDHGFAADELGGLSVKELDELLPDAPEATDTGDVTDGSGEYPKDFLFGQTIQDSDRRTLKAVETEVDYRIINFKSGQIEFVKDQEVSKDDLKKMSDYQKEYYLK